MGATGKVICGSYTPPAITKFGKVICGYFSYTPPAYPKARVMCGQYGAVGVNPNIIIS